jgi:hypothetical protein
MSTKEPDEQCAVSVRAPLAPAQTDLAYAAGGYVSQLI